MIESKNLSDNNFYNENFNEKKIIFDLKNEIEEKNFELNKKIIENENLLKNLKSKENENEILNEKIKNLNSEILNFKEEILNNKIKEKNYLKIQNENENLKTEKKI
jgi:hypothetical protein